MDGPRRIATAEIPWLEIRELWERAGKSETELAVQFGFKSRTSIVRRRIADGWVRNLKAIDADVTVRAVSGLEPVSVRHIADTSPTHGQSQQVRAFDAPVGLGVSGKNGEDTSASNPETPLARKATIDEQVEDYLDIKAQAKRRHLLFAQKLQATSARMIEAIDGVLAGPLLTGGEDDLEDRTPYGLAIISLRAINADKDTLNGLLKAAADSMDKGIKLERLVLGMDGQEDPGRPDQLPPGIMPQAQLVAYYAQSEQALELLSNALREIEQARPATIDGQSERTK